MNLTTLGDSLTTTGAWLQRCGSFYVSNHNRLQILIAVYLEFTTPSQSTKERVRKVCDDHGDVPFKIFIFVLIPGDNNRSVAVVWRLCGASSKLPTTL